MTGRDTSNKFFTSWLFHFPGLFVKIGCNSLFEVFSEDILLTPGEEARDEDQAHTVAGDDHQRMQGFPGVRVGEIKGLLDYVGFFEFRDVQIIGSRDDRDEYYTLVISDVNLTTAQTRDKWLCVLATCWHSGFGMKLH